MKPLLLLVDLQLDYLRAEALEPSVGRVVERATALLEGCRALTVPVAHVWTTVDRTTDRRMPHWKRDDKWMCEKGTAGHAPPKSLAPLATEFVAHKTGFSAFGSGALDAALREAGTDTLLVCGVHLHACVRQTVLDAYERGFAVWVADDATGSDDPVHGAISKRYLEARAARFATVDRLLAMLRMGVGEWQPERPATERTAEALRQARSASIGWRKQPVADTTAMFQKVADRLEDQAEDLAAQMAREIGKPVRYGRVEALRSAAMLRAVAARAESGVDNPGPPGVILRRRPHGVAALITPWNNPIYIPLGKIAPALLHGNTALWKPAPEAETVSRRVLDLLLAAGCPPGVVELVFGGADTAQQLMADPCVNVVSITGSSQAGYSAQEFCARRRIPLQAELGGNNAALVWPDADLKDAARQIADGAFAMAGQRCTANRRVVVHEACRSEFLALLCKETSALEWGDPLQPATRIGPLVSAESCRRVSGLVARAVREAGSAMTPHGNVAFPTGARFDGAWHPPTIICCEDPTLEIVQEEAFGPVLVVQTARDWDHAIHLCNGVKQGLAAAVFTRSREIATRFLDSAQAGILKVNASTADAAVDVPFGGWKASGLGPPEHGSFDLQTWTLPQTIYVEGPGAQHEAKAD